MDKILLNFADQLRLLIKREVFSDDDLHIVLSGKSSSAVLSGLSRSLVSHDIQKIKRGLYLFGDRLRRGPVQKFVVANHAYAPSYVSFESALSFHELIPEGVYVTTSACSRAKKKHFRTPIGDFSYDQISGTPFFIGVEKYTEQGGALVANPIKALFDLIYLRRKDYRDTADLEADLRVDPAQLAKELTAYSYQELAILAESYGRQRITKFLHRIAKELK